MVQSITIKFLVCLKIIFLTKFGDMMKTLSDVKPGETVTLVKYHNTGDIDLRRHLLGMGFVKGAQIHIKKVATLGDPIEMSIKGYDVCLRKEEAKNIEVE